MKRLAFAATAAAAALAIPASAAAASTGSGVVLSAGGHSVQVVNAGHSVSAYRITGAVPRMRIGSEIDYTQNGSSISHVRVVGSTSNVRYYAHVVRNAAGRLVLSLADGRTVSFNSSQIKARKLHKGHAVSADAASGISITVNAPPGTTVLVNETVAADGSVSVTITITNAPNGGGGNTDATASGTVTDVQLDSFGIVDENTGTTTRFTMDPDALAAINMAPCDTVDVSYQQDGATLVADNVNDYGSSDGGACDGGAGTYYPAQDVVGNITDITDSSVSINTADDTSMTFPVLPSSGLLSGFALDDSVDITYSQDPDGTLYVADIEYAENDSTGVVVAVSESQLTIVDDSTGQQDVFTADPSQQLFDGVAIGDQVDVTWHQAADGSQVADNIDDSGPAESSDHAHGHRGSRRG